MSMCRIPVSISTPAPAGDTVGSGSSASLHSAATRRTAHGIRTATLALLGLAALTSPAATMALERVGAVALESGESRNAASLPAELNLAVIRSAALDAAPEYHIDSDGRGTNPRHGLTLSFTAHGAHIDARRGELDLRLERFGRGRGGPVRRTMPRIEGARVEYDRGAGLSEWFVNLPKGVEQGWTVAERPPGTGVLALELDTARSPDAVEPDRLTWSDLVYRGLVAMDAQGRALPSRWVHEGAQLRIEVDDREAVYPVVIDPWVEEAKLAASDGAAFDFFGVAVALAGDTALVGANSADVDGNVNQGAAYVFTRDGEAWSEQAKLVASDGAVQDLFGWSVALAGDTALVGALNADVDGNVDQGAVWVFVRDGESWSQQAKLVASDGAAFHKLGFSVALAEDIALIGSTAEAAYVFTRDGETWSEQGKLTSAGGAAGGFGLDVALLGDTALVGARFENFFQGAAYVFTRSGDEWTQQAKLTAFDGASGDLFGISVALSGETAVVGSPFVVVDGNFAQGAVYAYVRDGETWTQQAKLVASDGAAENQFGAHLALSGDTLMVGAALTELGTVYVFHRDGESWTEETRLTAFDGASGDLFGISVALSGDSVLVGASQAVVGDTTQGAAYVFVDFEPPPDVGTLEGTVRSLGRCGAEPKRLAGATVEITGSQSTYTAETGSSGFYRAFLPEEESPLDIMVTSSGHLPAAVQDIGFDGGDIVVQDFDLLLDAPCAAVEPTSYSVELAPGQSTTETLTIGNLEGAAELSWEISTSEPPVAGEARGADGFFQPSKAARKGTVGAARRGEHTPAAMDMASILGGALPGLRPSRLSGDPVDCDVEPGIIIHDDGTAESAYSIPLPGFDQVIFVDRFTPSAHPSSLRAVCLAFVTLGAMSLDFEIVVFDDDGTDGAPGSELGALPATAEGIPGDLGQLVWFSFDISPLSLTIDSGSVYIGARWAPSAIPTENVFLAADESAGNPPGFAGGFVWRSDMGAWLPIQGQFAQYRSLFVRAVENPGGCLEPSAIPWLSLNPDSGNVPAGGSTPVDVTVDATGLDVGEYQASICISTNDAGSPLAVVRVTLMVNGGGPSLTFDPTSLDFGDVEVGSTSEALFATLQNTGDLDATGLTFGPTGGGFESDASACGDTLPTGGSCAVSVTFTPQVPGPAGATLHVDNNEGAMADLDLSGNGVEGDDPVIEVDPNSLSSTLPSGETETQPLTIANLGGGVLEWEVTDEDAGLQRIDGITLEPSERSLASVVTDPAGDFAYFGNGNLLEGRVVKIDLKTFERVDAITLENGEAGLQSAVIDPAGDFAYFGTLTPGRVVKIDLETFERVDAITLESGEDFLFSAVIDPAGDFAYFGTVTVPGRVVKIDLETFERVEAITLENGEDLLFSAVIDPAGEFAYFGTSTSPGRVVKIDLETFERVEAVELEIGEDRLLSAVIDPAGNFAYFGTFTFPGQVVKIDLGTFERVEAVELETGEDELVSAVIDPTGGFAYFGTGTLSQDPVPGRVVKIDLETFERVDAITLESDEDFLFSAVIAPAGDFAYFGTGSFPGQVVKIGLGGQDCTLPDWVSVDPMSGSVLGGNDQVVLATFDAGDLEPGDYEATLCLASNDPTQPWTLVPLVLTVTPSGAPELAFAPESLDFGEVEVGSTSLPQTATLQNIGSGDVTGLTLGPTGSAFEADTGACGDTLPSGASCEVSVTFTPVEPGPTSATLEVTSDQDASAGLGLAGTGVSDGVITPVALEVDPEALLSDGNGVFEPGELIEVAPAWRNDGLLDESFTGTASSFNGLDGANYLLPLDDADYGNVGPGATASCLDTGVCYWMGVNDPAVRPATHWRTTFDETLSEGTTHTWSLHIGDSFVDVPRTSPFYAAVETLLHHGVTGGCTATEYCPTGTNTRGQMAVFLLKAAESGEYTPPACEAGQELFADVPFDSPLCPWIEELAARQVTSGCGGGNYCPGSPVTRAQMAVFLLKAFEGGSYTPPECAGEFTDVICPSTFAAWIEELSERGITGGCSADPPAYCPSAPVTRQQMAVFVTKTFGLTLYGP